MEPTEVLVRAKDLAFVHADGNGICLAKEVREVPAETRIGLALRLVDSIYEEACERGDDPIRARCLDADQSLGHLEATVRATREAELGR